MDLKPGSRWRSAVCATEVVIVRPPNTEATLECGGCPMIPHSEPKPEGKTPAADFVGGTQLSKRYADDETGLEVLCTKPGAGTLAIGGRPIGVKEAKKLPSSD